MAHHHIRSRLATSAASTSMNRATRHSIVLTACLAHASCLVFMGQEHHFFSPREPLNAAQKISGVL